MGDILVIEITGMPGAGKSTLLESDLCRPDRSESGCVAFRRTWSDGGSLLESIRFELLLWRELVVHRLVSMRQARWLWRRARGVEAGIGMRLNILRNCLLKFAYRSAIRRMRFGEAERVYIDEGISHVPFLLQSHANGCGLVDAFVAEFAEQLQELRVLFVEAPSALAQERLRSRGHKRIAAGDERSLRQFVEVSARTAECLKRRRDAFAAFEITCSR